MSWKLWTGEVTKARIRIPATLRTVAAYGSSLTPLGIRSGSVGTIQRILPAGASKPSFVLFNGSVNYSLAAEIKFRKSENSEVMWKDVSNSNMKQEEFLAIITYPALDMIEIEYNGK